LNAKQTNKHTKHLLNASMHIGAKVAFFLLHTHKRKEKKRKKNPVAKWRKRKEEQRGPTGNPQPRSNGEGEGDEKMDLCANSLSPCASRNSCRVAAEKKNP
jgi:hypothetical protein